MKQVKYFLIIGLICMGALSSMAKSYPKSIQKRINKAVKYAYETNELNFSSLELNAEILNQYPQINEVRIEEVKAGEQMIGYAAYASSLGKNDYFDYLVLFDADKVIQKVVVLFYRSSYGGEIMARYWLKQFEGKSKGQQMEFEKDIDSISGATLSAPSITEGVKALSLVLTEL